MGKKYVIRWKSIKSGRSGLGKGLFTREEASQIIAELNREYPEFEHAPVDATPVSATASVIELDADSVKKHAA